MKNLKKAFSLVLAAAMLCSLMVFNAGAAFTDNADIENDSAVGTVSALGIIGGYPDGSFQPDKIVTRAEMAKMICVALNGGNDPMLGASSTSYTDVVGHWAAGYIEYCSALGIIGGMGNGLFAPDAPVTGSQAAKMLLVALGYDAVIEGFTGPSWEINTNVKANTKGLYAELSINPAAGLSRDNAAQMIYNALEATLVEYDYKLVTGSNGQLTTQAVAKDVANASKDTILETKFNATTEYGTLVDISYNATKGEYTYGVDNNNSPASVEVSYTGKVDFSNLFMQNVKIMYKGTDRSKLIGITSDGSEVLLSGMVGSLPDNIAAGATSIKYAGTTYKVDSGTIPAYPFNDVASASFVLNDIKGAPTTPTNNPFSFALIDNDDDGKGDLLVYYPFSVTKVTYVGPTTFTLQTGGSKTKSSVIYYDDIAKNDFVKVTAAANTISGKDTYEKVETVIAGEVTSIRGSNEFNVGGTWYKIYTGVSQPSVEDEIEKVAVVNGYAFTLTTSAAADTSDYAVVIRAAAASGMNKDQAELIFSDGTKKTVDTDADYSGTLVGDLVTYTINSDDEYVLTAASATPATAGFDFVAGTTYNYASGGKTTIGGYYIADDAIVFLYNSSTSKYSVISGSELAKFTAATVTNAYGDNDDATGLGAIKLAFVTSTASSGDYEYGYLTAAPEAVKDGNNTVYSVTFWDGEKTVTAITKNTTSSGAVTGLAKNAIIKFSYDGAKININSTYLLSGAPSVTGSTGYATGAIIGYANDEVKIAYSKTTEDIDANTAGNESVISTSSATGMLEVDDKDTVIIYIDRATSSGVEGGSIQLASDTAGGNKIANVFFMSAAGSVADLLVIDVANDILDVQK